MDLANQKDNGLAAKDLLHRIQELESLVETISRSKMMWESTFDVISDPVLIIDKEFQIKRANKALAKACGENIKDVIGKPCYKIFAGRDQVCPRCPVSNTLESHDHQYVELDMFPTHRQYNVNAYAVNGLGGDDDESIVLHYRDITDQKQLQRKLTHTEKMAAVGTLAGGVAHEINNPLGGILAFVQLVMRELNEDHRCMEDLKEIEDAALRCKKIVRNLLDFSRQNLKEEMETINLNEIINRSLSIIRINAKQFDAEVVLDLSENLPHVHGDFSKLQQVLINLVTNAFHAMKSMAPAILSISTFTNPERSKVFLQVKDTGSGIAKDKIDRIFDPYFTTKDQGEGTGLGLSICYKIIQEHKGKIDVESEEGKGTAITLQFQVGLQDF